MTNDKRPFSMLIHAIEYDWGHWDATCMVINWLRGEDWEESKGF